MSKVALSHIWKIFGPNPAYALTQISEHTTREMMLEESGHVLAVRDVSLAIQEGEIFVVMGLSGSGKSTLIRCLSCLIEPTSGQVHINGRDVTAMNESQRRDLRRHQVSMVFQRFGLFPHRRVIDNVAYGLEVRGLGPAERYEKAAAVLKMVGLESWENYFPHELSGGMQQRVGLARALAVDPEILLCDEPFSALDPLIRRDMQNELLRLQQTLHKTIIFITHDFLEALKLGDRIAIMKDGVIVQVGTPAEIVARPVNDYVREFTRDVPVVKVLTAGAVAKPAPPTLSLDDAVPATLTLEALIPQLAGRAAPLPVVDPAGNLLGVVDQQTILTALAGN